MGELESVLLILLVENFYRHSWKRSKILLGLFHHLCCGETLGINLYIYPTGVAAKTVGAFNCVKWCRKKKSEMNEHTDVYFMQRIC